MAQFERYGQTWDDEEVSDLTIELWAFRYRLTEEEGGLGAYWHFKNIVAILWGPDSSKPFVWHPWAERMLKNALNCRYLAIAGCASSGKTDFLAVWGIVNFLLDPANTKILITSTTLKDSKMRVWGVVVKYWMAAGDLPGKVVDSMGIIRYKDPETGATTDLAGIALIAGDPSREKDAVGKMIGFKAKHLLLLADELPELSEAILQAALSNLSRNPNFQMIGAGNPASHYDAFGVFSEPAAGWKSITDLTEEWDTNYGRCIRFDGLKSPNILEAKTIYPWLPTQEQLDNGIREMGVDSPGFWRMWRGFFCPTGTKAAIYSESEIIECGGEASVIWREPPVRLAVLDASFSDDGDRAMAMEGYLGWSTEGVHTLAFGEHQALTEDVNVKNKQRNVQIAEQYRDFCESREISARAAATDSTGAGGPFADILSLVWKTNAFLRIYFGGKPSARTVSEADSRLATEAFENRVTELWFSGKGFLKAGQLRGLNKQACREMCARASDSRKKGGSVVVVAESKLKMKARVGYSPDVADAVFMLIELARERFGFKVQKGKGAVHAASSGLPVVRPVLPKPGLQSDRRPPASHGPPRPPITGVPSFTLRRLR